ncbi:MAG TPA: hypothetical protein VHN15_08165 [Thermoanaerobaculia bacterium]|nr:hypothetical protein [Thermoanaerobaculia bacterium]
MNNKLRLAKLLPGSLALTAFLVLAFAAAGIAAPTWRPLPPFGGPVTALAASQGTGGAPLLYAGTATAGTVRSRNGGVTWTPPVRVPDAFRILDLVIDRSDPAVVFASAETIPTIQSGQESAGVLRSLDGGARWQLVNQGLLSPAGRPWRIQDLETDPFDARKLYAATEDGLYQTLDRGDSWQQVALDGRLIVALVANPARPGALLANVLRRPDLDLEMLASTDGGVTWAPSNAGLDGQGFKTLVFHPTVPDTVFALGQGWPTHVSHDGGATWTSLGQPLSSLAFGPGGILFGSVYDAGGVLTSTDGGLHWSPSGPLPDRIAELLAVNGRLYAAGNRGVWVSDDHGASWRPSSRGLSARNVGELIESGSELYGTFAEGALASATGGTSWRPLRDADDPEATIARVVAGTPSGVVYAQTAGLEFGENEGFVRSTDRGTTWTEIAEPGLGGHFSSFAVDPRRPAVLYAGSTEQSGNDFPFCHLARSVNRGRSWTCLLGEVSVDRLAVEPSSSNLYLIAAGNVFVLTEGTRPGLEFRGNGLPPNGTHDFAFDPRQPGALYAATDAGVFKTVNGGRSWTRLTRGMPTGEAAYSVAVDPVLPRVVYAGLRGRVYRSLNAGRTWQLLGDGLPADAEILDLLASASDPHRLYAVAAGYGLFVQDPTVP